MLASILDADNGDGEILEHLDGLVGQDVDGLQALRAAVDDLDADDGVGRSTAQLGDLVRLRTGAVQPPRPALADACLGVGRPLGSDESADLGAHRIRIFGSLRSSHVVPLVTFCGQDLACKFFPLSPFGGSPFDDEKDYTPT